MALVKIVVDVDAEKGQQALTLVSSALEKAGAKSVQLEQINRKLEQSFGGSSTTAGKFADAVGRTSTTLARSASAFGLPAQALKTLDDVMDVAELGLNNASKSALTASLSFKTLYLSMLGPIAAAAAIGAAIGGLLNKFEFVRKGMDELTGAAHAADALKVVEGSQAAFQAKIRPSFEGAAQKQVDNLRAAGVSVKAIHEQYKHLTPELQKQLGISEAQVKAAEKQAAVVKKSRDDLAQWMAGFSAANVPTGFVGPTDIELGAVDKITTSGKTAAALGNIDFEKLLPVTQAVKKEVKSIHLDLQQLPKMTYDWGSALQNIANMVTSMGGKGGLFGSILGGSAGIGAVLQGFERRNKEGDVVQSGLSGLFGSFKGGGIGGILAGISGVGSIAGAAIGIGKAIFGLFRSDPVKKAQQVAGKILGEGISREMAEQIRNEAKQTGQSVEQVARRMKEERDRAKEEERKRNVAQGLGTAAEALKNFPWADPKLARAAGGMFASVFFATVKEHGIAKAAETMRPAWDAMMESLAKAGIAPDAALGRVGRLMDLAGNPEFAAASQAAAATGQVIGGMRQAGMVDTGLLQSGGAVAAEALAKAQGAGATAAEAYTLIAPALQELVNASKASGIELDANTQALLEEAKKNGINIIADPMIELVDINRKMLAIAEGQARGGVPFRDTDVDGLSSARGLGVMHPKTMRRGGILRFHAGEGVMVVPANMHALSSARGYGDYYDYDPRPGHGGSVPTPTVPPPDTSSSMTPAEVAAAVAQIIRPQLQVLVERPVQQVSYTVAPQIQENPLLTRETREQMRRFTIEELERAIRNNEGSLTATIRRATRTD